jgi:hypothetical protein
VSAVIAALQTYLEEQPGGTVEEPVPLELSKVDLSAEDTAGLFAALAAADKYVDLDLSGCTGLTEWGIYTNAGKVVSLVLPDTVTEIAPSTSSTITFASLTSLKEITANKTKTVGDYAFRGCAALKTASLPAATVIGTSAFAGCASLTDIRIPSLTTVETSAFASCAALSSIELPSATTIGAYAFKDCAALETANLPTATVIGLGSVDLKVEGQTPDMNGGDEGSGKLCVARSSSPPALEGAEDVFNDVPCPQAPAGNCHALRKAHRFLHRRHSCQVFISLPSSPRCLGLLR